MSWIAASLVSAFFLGCYDLSKKHALRDNAVLPVLFLSAKSAVDDRVKGLQAGGDDYLTKPFAFSELLARVQALIRRATQAPEATKLTAGDVTLDLVTREVTCAEPYEVAATGPGTAAGRRIVAYDFGIKRTILRHLSRLGDVTVVPASTPGSDA